MGPSEVAVASAIAAACVYPVNLAVEHLGPDSQQVEPMVHRYVMKQDCKGPDDVVGPCIVCAHTGKPLGLSPSQPNDDGVQVWLAPHQQVQQAPRS